MGYELGTARRISGVVIGVVSDNVHPDGQYAVKLDLPKASSAPNLTKPDNIQLALDAEGRVWWNGETVDDAGLQARMQAAAKHSPQPEVHLRADGGLAYRNVAKVMSKAAKAGLTRIGFVTDPNAAN